jgi:hypothetical protein
MELTTRILKICIDFLFVQHPTRSSLGIIFGAAAKPIVKILAVWSTFFQAILTADVSVREFMIIGFALSHVPSAINAFSGKRILFSENEEKALSIVNKLNIPDFQKQQMYLKIVEKILERAVLTSELLHEISN